MAVWSKEEIQYLKDSVGTLKITTIAKNLGRSYVSVQLKMKRLNIYNTKIQSGLLTMNELAIILGVDRKTIEGWVVRHGLKYKKRVTKEKRQFSFISSEDFWEWAVKHKDKVQFKDIEPNLLVPEPSWVNLERKREFDQLIIKKRDYQVWSMREEQELLSLRKEGYTYKKIGEMMNRSSVSVQRRYSRLSGNSSL
ncbi:DNA-binding protein [Virgibacillus oceani]